MTIRRILLFALLALLAGKRGSAQTIVPANAPSHPMNSASQTESNAYQQDNSGTDQTPGETTVLFDGVQDERKSQEDQKEQKAKLNKKVASAYKPLFFENDFSYLCDSAYQGHHWGERLKLRSLPNGGTLSIGGQYRSRYHNETNMRGLGLTGVDDQFQLHRTRIYGDLRLTPNIRIYGEMIDAASDREDFAPRPIEVNRTDMLNLFVDARLLANNCGELTARIGRQELLFGAQRAVSPLDWANTRRTFEGARLSWKTKKHTIDGFWTHPMRINDQSLDSPDRDQEFMGLYTSSKGEQGQTFDTYFLRYLNGRGANNFEFNTVGARWKGDRCGWLYDIESAFQFGNNTDGSDHAAGMATLGIGRKLSGHCWDPTLWLYYDWASGDNDLGAGNGFHHNQPLAHKYLGFMDLFGRRNVTDLNLLLTMQPAKKLKLLLWYHYFRLESQSDSPYSVVMTPFNGGNLPGSADLGHEIDFVANWKFNDRENLVLGYSHFIAGDYYSTTAGVPYNGDANFFYSQWTINF